MATSASDSGDESVVVTDREDESGPPVPKKAKKENNQTFLPRYHEVYPCLIASRKGPNFAHCTLCKSDFSVRSSGLYDCKRHVTESKSHKQFAEPPKAKSKQTLLKGFFGKENQDSEKSSLEEDVIRAEAILCRVIADLNLSLSSADKLTAAVKAMCPDSKIAQSKFLLPNS